MDNYFVPNKCPYNSILLKNPTVGERNDGNAGIKAVEKKTYLKLMDLEGMHGTNVRGQEENIIRNSTFLKDVQKEQALHAWSLVKPYDLDIDATANDVINEDILKAFFNKYKFKSLINIFE